VRGLIFVVRILPAVYRGMRNALPDKRCQVASFTASDGLSQYRLAKEKKGVPRGQAIDIATNIR
jgi:hypothetical protein